MPYDITHKGKKFIVSNQNTGRVVAAHDTKEKATTQMEAMNIREDELKQEYGRK